MRPLALTLARKSAVRVSPFMMSYSRRSSGRPSRPRSAGPCSNSPTRHIREGSVSRSSSSPLPTARQSTAAAALPNKYSHHTPLCSPLSTILPTWSPASIRRCASAACGEREGGIDHRLQPPASTMRPDAARDLVGDQRLERDRARPQRRAGQRQPPPHHLGEVDLGARRRAGPRSRRGGRPRPGRRGCAADSRRRPCRARRRRPLPPVSRFTSSTKSCVRVVDRVRRAERQRARRISRRCRR